MSASNTRNKGHSILNISTSYVVLDIETTGLNPSFDEIIEIACIRFTDNIEVDTFHSYVKPTPYEGENGLHYVDDFITGLTGITDNMLKDAPDFSNIANTLYTFIGDSVIVGHNVNFDINFLYDNFLTSIHKEFSNDFIDTMRIARIILPKERHHRLKDLCILFNITDTQHRAMNDCRITQSVLLHLLTIAKEKEIDLSQYKRHHNIGLSDLVGDTTLNDTSHLFYDKKCVFTGKLQKYTRKEAAQIVCNIGGHCENGVTKKTNFLIIGGLNNSPTVIGGKKLKA